MVVGWRSSLELVCEIIKLVREIFTFVSELHKPMPLPFHVVYTCISKLTENVTYVT